MKFILAVLLICLSIPALAADPVAKFKEETLGPPPAQSLPAPAPLWGPYTDEDRTLPEFQLDGLSSADLKEDLMILQVFSTRCPDTVTGQPLFVNFAKNTDLPVYGISLFDTKKDVSALLKDFGNPYKVIGYGGDTQLLRAFGISSYPHTFLINKKREVLWRYGNFMDENMIEQTLKPFIKKQQDTPR
jgi:cytochrome c biogenesis protein CcmG/thiol:disulfide interchange protein DsbE